jgi:hypothetical protein
VQTYNMITRPVLRNLAMLPPASFSGAVFDSSTPNQLARTNTASQQDRSSGVKLLLFGGAACLLGGLLVGDAFRRASE